jgi:hypothetical protein
LQKDLPNQKVFMPYKTPPHGELSDEKKQYNQQLARIRVRVEHAIGGMKRYFVLHYQNRFRKSGKLNEVLHICGGLWNFRKGFTVSTA